MGWLIVYSSLQIKSTIYQHINGSGVKISLIVELQRLADNVSVSHIISCS